ncbi:unnamed protein product [Ostreobium quekettii]|uniref:Uncharacterized protein n=1 Tax=Ostreobium quekettii TaxID=121088 RepID=A0A8S1JG18_9CHLO|nr:unnamed protein product [Ostreobium quekettii]
MAVLRPEAAAVIATSTAPPAHGWLGGGLGREVSGELIFQVELDAWDNINARGGRSRGEGEAAPNAFLQILRQWGTPNNSFCIQVLNDIQEVKNSLNLRSSKIGPRALGDALAAVGYKVHIRTAVGGRDESLFLELHHEFLVVFLEGSGDWEEDAEVIVEPNFRDQFKILNPTLRYSQIVDTIPEEYAGPVHRLGDLVQLLCKEMASSFSSMGTTLPPWRCQRSMISRWRPKVYRDERLDSAAGRPSECGPRPEAHAAAAGGGGGSEACWNDALRE